MDYIKKTYIQSESYKTINKTLGFFKRVLLGSLIFRFLSKILNFNQENVFLNSKCFSYIQYLYSFFLTCFRKISLLVNYENSYTKRILDIFTNLGSIDFFFKSTIISFLLEDFLCIDLKKKSTKIQKNRLNLRFIAMQFLIIFFISTALIVFFGSHAFFRSLFFVFFSIFILRRPKFGIFVIIFSLPLVKTKFILLFSVITCISVLLNKDNHEKNNAVKLNLLDMSVLLFALLLVYQFIISYDLVDNFRTTVIYLFAIMMYFIVKNIIIKQEDLFTVASLMILALGIVALIGIRQRYIGLTLDTKMWIDNNMFDNTVRVYSTLDNPNVLGEYLLLIIPIAFSSLYYFSKKSCKILSLFILLLSCVCMLLTLSRGAWIGLIVSILFFMLMQDTNSLFLFLILALISPMIIPKSFIKRFVSIGNMCDTSTSYRFNIWLASIEMLKNFWPIGIGSGQKTFALIFRKYAYAASYALHSHNFYLQILLETGISGMLIVLTIILLFYKNTLHNNKYIQNNFIKNFQIALCASLTGYLIQGMVDNIWYNYRVLFLFWIIIALSNTCYKLSDVSTWDKFQYFKRKFRSDNMQNK